MFMTTNGLNDLPHLPLFLNSVFSLPAETWCFQGDKEVTNYYKEGAQALEPLHPHLHQSCPLVLQADLRKPSDQDILKLGTRGQEPPSLSRKPSALKAALSPPRPGMLLLFSYTLPELLTVPSSKPGTWSCHPALRLRDKVITSGILLGKITSASSLRANCYLDNRNAFYKCLFWSFKTDRLKQSSLLLWTNVQYLPCWQMFKNCLFLSHPGPQEPLHKHGTTCLRLW